jgi:hypothetical protein
MSDSKYITVELTESVFRALIKASASSGLHPHTMAGMLIIRGMSEMSKELDSPEMRLFELAQAVSKNRDYHYLLIQIAAHLTVRPDDVMGQQLQDVCTDMGYSLEDIMSEATKKTSERLLMFDATSPTAQAAHFLLGHMEVGTEYPVRQILAEAERHGLKENTVKAARASLRIQSIRRSDGFVWVLPNIPSGSDVMMEEAYHNGSR